MKALLHFPSMRSAPEGVWWVDAEGKYQHHYVPGSSLEGMGIHTLGTMHTATADPDDIFEHLTERSPYFDFWETVDFTDKSSAVEVLKLIRATYKKAPPKAS